MYRVISIFTFFLYTERETFREAEVMSIIKGLPQTHTQSMSEQQKETL